LRACVDAADLTSAQEIRDLVSSNRFKLFAAAAKTKVVE
jgi:hypothetical protein